MKSKSSWFPILRCLATAALLVLAYTPLQAQTKNTERLEGWFNRTLQWGSTFNGDNSRLSEGSAANLRFVAPLASGTHTVYLKYDFSTGTNPQRFIDYLGSTTLNDATLTTGLSGTGTGTSYSGTIDLALPPGRQPAWTLRVFNASVTSFGSYTLVNGIKVLPVTISVSTVGGKTKLVVIGYSAHLAKETDYGLGNGAAGYPGASRKAFANADGKSDSNVSINPGAIVRVADLQLTQVAAPSQVQAGNTVTYTLTVANLGPSDAANVVVADNPPSGATIATTWPGATISGNNITLGTIPIGQQALITVTATAPCGPIVNSATVTSSSLDEVPANNSVSTTVTPVDSVSPTISGCPTDPVIAFAAPTTCGTAVTLPTLTAADNCTTSPTLLGSRSDGQAINFPFPIGTTTVMFTARDAAGNSSSCSYDVIVLPLNLAWPVATRLNPSDPDNSGIETVSIEECINVESQSRWYKFKVQPNSKLLIALENLPENYDLVLFKDIKKVYDQLTQAESTDDLTHLNAEFAADAFSAAAFSTEAFAGAAFSGAAFSTEEFAGAAWSGAAFSGAAFSGAAWSPDVYAPDTYFGAAFSGAAWSGAAWSGAAWSGTEVAGAAFSGAAFSGAAWSGAAWSGAAWSGAAFSGAAFSTEQVSGAAWSGAAFSGAAFSDAQLRSIVGVSGFPGIGNEVILANTWDHDEDFYIRIRGRNGAFAPGQNFKLSVLMKTGVCNDLDGVERLPASTTTVPTAGPVKTLIVTDYIRLAQYSGTAADVATLQEKLNTFAGRPEIQGVVIDLGLDARVLAANAQSDANPTCPSAKNIVAQAIREIILAHRTAHPGIEYIVIVGNDAVVPFFRHLDQGLLANENGFIPPVYLASASDAALKLGYFLTQDYYAAACELSLKVGSIPLPDLAIGRLVETPASIMAMLAAYESVNGLITFTSPATGLVTGYDFLSDVAELIRDEYAAGLNLAVDQVDSLIQPGGQLPDGPDTWTADDLRQRLLGSRHDLIFLGGHFSAVGALAADYRTRMTSSELAGSIVNLVNSIVVSVGCHSGYNIVTTDAIPDVTEEPDWAEAFAHKGASLIAGTGYQYGDTVLVEYSERLYLNLARQLRVGSDPVAIGGALVEAKKLYLAETPFMRGLHEKALLQATLFGLPMLRIDMPGTRISSPIDTSDVPGVTAVDDGDATPNEVPGETFGLKFADLSLDPITLNTHTETLQNVDETELTTVIATYFSAANAVVGNPAEPLLPLEIRNATVPGQVLRGVALKYAEYDDDTGADSLGFLPFTSAPATELSGVHTPFHSAVHFPIRFWNVNYFDALCGPSDPTTRLFVTPAQFISSAPGSPLGTFRKFSRIDFRLYYNDNIRTYGISDEDPSEPDDLSSITPALSAPPYISKVSDHIDTTDPDAQSVTFQVRVLGNPFAGMHEVWVTYTGVAGTPGFHGKWRSLNLTQPNPDTDSSLWEGTLPTGSVNPGLLRYFVNAVSGVGLCALDTRLGYFYIPGFVETVPTTTSVLTLDPANPASAPYSQKVAFRAALKAGSTSLAGQVVTFALGTQEALAVTDTEGVATVEIPVLGFPGSYDLRASFAGYGIYKPSAASQPFTITKQGSTVQLNPVGTIYIESGSATPFIATLTDNLPTPKPLTERTVFFVFKPYLLDQNGNPTSDYGTPWYYFPVITDFKGRASFGTLPPNSVPPGIYDLDVYFGTPIPGLALDPTDPRYNGSTTSGLVIYDTTVVVDNLGPSGGLVTAKPDIMVRPNHKLVNVSLTVTPDALLKSQLQYRIACVGSDEPTNGTGDGDAAPDWIFNAGQGSTITEVFDPPGYSITECVTDPNSGWSDPAANVLNLQLRSERAQNGDGRIYTIRIEIRDPSGNIATVYGNVFVPK